MWEASSSPEPGGGPEEGPRTSRGGPEEGGQQSSGDQKGPGPRPGLGERSHVGEPAPPGWECRPTDQRVTLQKEITAGFSVQAAHTKEWLWFRKGTSNAKQVESSKRK